MDDIDGGVSRAREMGSSGSSTPWEPIQMVFKRYFPEKMSDNKAQTLRAVVKKKPVSIACSSSFICFGRDCEFHFILECIKASFFLCV